MKHYTDTVKQILINKGYQFVKIAEKSIGVYYLTPNNQLVKFEDTDLIVMELYGN